MRSGTWRMKLIGDWFNHTYSNLPLYFWEVDRQRLTLAYGLAAVAYGILFLTSGLFPTFVRLHACRQNPTATATATANHNGGEQRGKVILNLCRTSQLSHSIFQHISIQLILRRELECPVCITVKLGQIYNCQNGHIVCQKCHGRLSQPTKCPSCQVRMPNLPERNLAIERMIDRLGLGIISCTNRGCTHEGPKPVMDAHAAKCKYRLKKKKSKKATKAKDHFPERFFEIIFLATLSYLATLCFVIVTALLFYRSYLW